MHTQMRCGIEGAALQETFPPRDIGKNLADDYSLVAGILVLGVGVDIHTFKHINPLLR